MIKTIAVDGYRLLDNFEADLGDLTVVIGANATGKSTLHDILWFVAQAAERPLSAVLKERGGLASLLNAGSDAKAIRWRINFTKPTNNPVWASLPIEPDRELVYEASVSAFGPYSFPLPEYEALRYAHPEAGFLTPFKFLEYRNGVGRVFDFEIRRLVDFSQHMAPEKDFFSSANDSKDEKHPADRTEGDLKGLLEAASEGPSLLLTQVRFPQKFFQVSSLRWFFGSWAFYPGFLVDKWSPIRTQPADVEPVTLLWQRGENLATVLHEILTKHEYRDAADRLRDWLRSAYPAFEQITAEAVPGTKGKVAVRWHEGGMMRPLDAFELSDGVLRFLCLAAALNNPRPTPLVAIDEPEAGLHPSLLPIVADMLKAAAEETQVLVTTHSPDLLNHFALDDVAVMVREESRARWYRPSTRQTLKVLLESVEGQSLGDLHRSGELEALA